MILAGGTWTMRLPTSTLAAVFFLCATTAAAAPVDLTTAVAVAAAHARADGRERAVVTVAAYPAAATPPLLFVAHLAPRGFVVVAGDDTLPPVIGYSFLNDFAGEGMALDAVVSLLTADLRRRLAHLDAVPPALATARASAWRALSRGEAPPAAGPSAQVWPPAGSTSTGGWVETAWDQYAPFSDQCPMDGAQRSLAGCPAVAMAQIVNYYRTTNGTSFTDADDYYHNYLNDFWIDDDHAAYGFPAFPVLSASLTLLDQHYAAGAAPTAADAAALVFACGVAAHQVYDATGSGTFGVDQALHAYQRFGVAGVTLLDASTPDLFARLAEDMREARPAHLAVVDPGWQYGHNVVVDGYDSGADRYHVNFGWGGSSDGWYLLPTELPMSLTVIEGVVVGISIPLEADGFEAGDLTGWDGYQT